MSPIFVVILWIILQTHRQTDATDPDQTPSRPVIETRRGPEIYQLHIQTDITYRFATTQVICKLANKSPEAKEAVFVMTIPKTAFINSFVMTIDGVDYHGEVKEKVKAKRQYEAAKRKGESAGRVSAVQARNTFQFRVAISIAAQSKVDYNLTYVELLQRKLGYYEYILNIDPGQVVRDLRVDVYIRESREITEVRVPPLKRNTTEVVDVTKANPDVSVIRDGKNAYHILYNPDEATQQRLSETGVSGQLIVQYDVSRATDAGEIQVIDGYFVHYFAPSGLEPVNKNVLFVIDTSGSMAGDKIQQTKDAMYTILDDLREGDMFNIITFSSYVTSWSDNVKEATSENIVQAKQFVKDIQAEGGTNLNDALLRGISFLEEESVKEWEKKPSMIILLTDGEPTSGITTISRILSNVRKSNRGRYSIFSLGFGHDLDFNLLQKISLQNKGVARRIYAESDADLQLEGFYNEVSTPVLADVEISYVGDVTEPDSVTYTKFPAFFRGSEIVVSGKLKRGVKNLSSRIQGHASSGYMQFDANVRIPKVEREALQTAYTNFTEKLWAFLTIRKLLDKTVQTTNATEKAEAKQRALDLALKYSFVTPLTSMVVTKPNEESRNFGELKDTEAVSDEERHPSGSQAHYLTSRKLESPRGTTKRRPSFVDNDPHFILHVDGITDAICFNLDGPPGLKYQLLHDKVSGTVINGRVVGKNIIPKGHKYPRTYIGELMILRKGVSIHITPYKVTYQFKKRQATFDWKNYAQFNERNVSILIEGKTKVFVQLSDNIVFAVLRHLVNPNHKHKVDFLGLYVVNQEGLSTYCHGLIGQFLYQTASLHETNTSGSQRTATLRLRGPHNSHRTVFAKAIRRRDMDRKDHVTCWNVRDNGRGLLEGKHTDYVIPSLRHTKSVLLHYRMAKQLFTRSNKSWR